MRNFVLVMAISLGLNACGEFSYKRGANVAQLEKTRQTCQAKHIDNDIEKCMEANGWTVQKLDSFEIMTETSANTDEEKAKKFRILNMKKAWFLVKIQQLQAIQMPKRLPNRLNQLKRKPLQIH